MHELSLCRSILDIVNDHVTDKPGRHVKKITLEIGQLSGVDESALRFSFDVIIKGTIAESALLEIIPLPGQAMCNTCHKIITLEHYFDPCKTCGQFTLTVTQGDELRVKSMEID